MVTSTSTSKSENWGYGFLQLARGIEDPMNTATLQIEEGDNTSNLAAREQAAAFGQSEALGANGAGSEQRRWGLLVAWHPSTHC